MYCRKTFLILLLMPVRLWGQTADGAFDMESWIDRLFPVQEENFEYDDVYDRLFSLHQSPVEINSASDEDIEGLIMLSEAEKQALMDYRRRSGPVLSVYELPLIAGWTRETAESVIPFIRIDPSAQKSGFRKRPSQHWMMLRGNVRMPLSAGYDSDDPRERFRGAPFGLTMRYRLKGQKYEAGVTVDQDPGEQFAWSVDERRYGPDYFSAYVMLKKAGVLDRLIVGNFALQYGQGLVFGSGWRRGKGTDPLGGQSAGSTGIRPYGSTFENRDFNGAAATVSLGNIRVTGFWSEVRRDALPVEDTIGEDDWYTTYIRTAGLHRNDRELALRHTIRDRSYGANVLYIGTDRNLKIGTGILATEYSIPLLPDTREYNKYVFRGRRNVAGTVYGSYVIDRFYFFGEASRSSNGGTAIIGGLHAGLHSTVHLSVHCRSYARDFHSLYGRAFGENTLNSNEQGVYIGLKILPSKAWEINLFYDRFHFPWLRYNADAPSSGDELMLAAVYRFRAANRLHVQFRLKNRERNQLAAGHANKVLEQETRLYARVEWARSPESGFWCRSRAQFLVYGFSGHASYGFMIAQDLGFKQQDSFSVSGRASVFRTVDWYSRQFMFEHGVLYSYSVPAFYGYGARSYALITLYAGRKWTYWLKAGHTVFFDRESAGSGPDMRTGKTHYDVSTQVRFRF